MPASQPQTKLEHFLREHRIKPAALARESGCARQHIVRIRMGRTTQMRRSTKEAIVAACCKLSRLQVTIEDLFD